MEWDVAVAGGSIAGLLCAREAARGGHSVIVIEEDHEIGTPEHCGGLVSIAGLGELGMVPSGRVFEHMIESAEVCAPNGDSFVVSASRQKVAAISRRDLDKQAAFQAQKNGAVIRTKTSFQGATDAGIRTSGGEISCRLFVDARGVSSLVQRDRTGILSSAQYEIYADWIRRGRVQVSLDQEKYPGFFAWVIPSGEGRGRVGVAGRGINVTEALDGFLGDREHSTIRKIFAPIWIKGPIERFVDGRTVTVGDAAGQAKPTTAGGIFSSGMGGVYAGRAISRFLESGDRADLGQYQKEWTGRFGGEFERQSLARRILERLDNGAINGLFKSVTPEVTAELEGGSFDFHAGSIVRLLGVGGSIRTAGGLVGGELRKLLGRDAPRF